MQQPNSEAHTHYIQAFTELSHFDSALNFCIWWGYILFFCVFLLWLIDVLRNL